MVLSRCVPEQGACNASDRVWGTARQCYVAPKLGVCRMLDVLVICINMYRIEASHKHYTKFNTVLNTSMATRPLL